MKHFYACVDADTGSPLGYVRATSMDEALEAAKKEWPEVTRFDIHRWDGVL